MNKLYVILATSLVLSACASSTPAPVRVEQNSELPAGTTGTLQTGTLTQSDLDAQAAQSKALQDKSVYFDYDEFEVKPEYRSIVQQQADFMNSHPGDVVTLQGNTDERGSNEFNLALGDKRASAVRKVLMLSGIADSRINTVSYGEEKPRLSCHAENCWKENRRVDFVHKLAN